jgi:precorrin-6B methylase 1
MFEQPCGITTQHTTNYEAIIHLPTQMSREAIPSSDKEAPSDIAAYYSQNGIKGSNKWCK